MDEEREAMSRDLQESTARLEEAERVAHLGYWEWDFATDHSNDGAAANYLRSSYFVVISSALGVHDSERLWVKQDRLCEGRDGDMRPLAGYHYMLFRIEAQEDRDDWDSLTAIQQPYEQAIEMLQNSIW